MRDLSQYWRGWIRGLSPARRWHLVCSSASQRNCWRQLERVREASEWSRVICCEWCVLPREISPKVFRRPRFRRDLAVLPVVRKVHTIRSSQLARKLAEAEP